ncbi:hypothetical protein CDL15_Pgr006417 [Punica granatum]|uniref:Uncharacterized protein n=1 Tax=Punica granatum TaxID=22663 RepID=A0A218XZM4_PUNGR|nr:hypothetical protein CDL15_Pgr006417 [Punica granatum]
MKKVEKQFSVEDLIYREQTDKVVRVVMRTAVQRAVRNNEANVQHKADVQKAVVQQAKIQPTQSLSLAQ